MKIVAPRPPAPAGEREEGVAKVAGLILLAAGLAGAGVLITERRRVAR